MTKQLLCVESNHEDRRNLQTPIKEMASLLGRHRLSFDQATCCLRVARRNLGVVKSKPAKRLPRNLTDAERDAFFRGDRERGERAALLAVPHAVVHRAAGVGAHEHSA